jgi:cytochrome c556
MTGRADFGFVLALLTLCASVAAATSTVVTDRQTAMKEMAGSIKTIDAIFKGQQSYSAQALKAAAKTISENAGATLVAHFAEKGNGQGSRAGADIWSDREHFDQLANDLKSYADLISVAAENNPQSMSSNMRMKPGEAMGGGPFGVHLEDKTKLAGLPAEHAFHLMIQTCTTCHVRFRTPG